MDNYPEGANTPTAPWNLSYEPVAGWYGASELAGVSVHATSGEDLAAKLIWLNKNVPWLELDCGNFECEE